MNLTWKPQLLKESGMLGAVVRHIKDYPQKDEIDLYSQEYFELARELNMQLSGPLGIPPIYILGVKIRLVPWSKQRA